MDAFYEILCTYYSDVIMRAMASQITDISIVSSTFCSGAGQRKYQSSASLALVRGIHRWPVNYKGPIARTMFPFDDVIMNMSHHNLHSFVDLCFVTVLLWIHNGFVWSINILRDCFSGDEAIVRLTRAITVIVACITIRMFVSMYVYFKSVSRVPSSELDLLLFSKHHLSMGVCV